MINLPTAEQVQEELGTQLTLSQRKTWRRYVRTTECYARANHEVKSFSVRHVINGIISIHFEIGMVDDEGTMASIYGRNGYHIFIGKRGGLTAVDGFHRNGKPRKNGVRVTGTMASFARCGY